MTEKILTDDEKNALLEGVESGDVEVQSSAGLIYASVAPFHFSPRARIAKNSFPRLQLLNEQIAKRLSRDIEQLLQCEVMITSDDVGTCSVGRLCEQLSGPSAVIVFGAAPLVGNALIVLEPAMLSLLVDAFFGGAGLVPDVPRRDTSATGFTNGEVNISNVFATVVLSAIKDTWAPLQEISTEALATEGRVDLVDIGGESDPVICTRFDVSIAGQQSLFRVVWPVKMVEPVLPIFEGQKGERDAVEDLRWAQAIRRRLADSVVGLTSNVGHARISLGELVRLSPGDIVEIESPQEATVMARHVPLIHGRLGVHQGRNAIETIEWIDRQ